MNTQATSSPQFYLTAPAACPYLPQEMERKVFTHLVGERAPELNDLLTQGGFFAGNRGERRFGVVETE